MKLIVGLGNPGKAYAGTRHNVGFRCIDSLGARGGITLSERRRLTVIGRGRLGEEEVVLAKPRTFMNRSGEAVSYLVDRFHTPLDDILVIYDDMDLPLGRVRIRPNGRAAGHRGVGSILAAVGSADFPRIRVGIGRPEPGMDEVEYVLGTFAADEKQLLDEAIATVSDAVMDILGNGFDWAMNRYN